MLNRNLTSANKKKSDTYQTNKFKENYYMIFALKKLFRKNSIPYLWHRKRPEMIAVNVPEFARLIFILEEDNYIRVQTIPLGNYTYCFQANSLPVLLKKLLHHKLITFHQLKGLELPTKEDKHVLEKAA